MTIDRIESFSPQVHGSADNGRFHFKNRVERMEAGHITWWIHTQGLGDLNRTYLAARKGGVDYAIVGREGNLTRRGKD